MSPDHHRPELEGERLWMPGLGYAASGSGSMMARLSP